MASIKTIFYSSHFERALRRLSLKLKDEVAKRETLFRRDCFDSRLKTHKLKGKYQEFWSFSITHKHRLVFRFLAPDKVYFIDIGDHSIYQ